MEQCSYMAERGKGTKAILMAECKSEGNQPPTLLQLADNFIQFYTAFVMHRAMNLLQRLGSLNRA